jgi:tryptophan 2,3-dioxygenase
MTDNNQRPVESTIVGDFSGKLSYSGYLSLDGLLAQQRPLSQPPHHDEMLFILQHQVAELWMKLIIHELSAAIEHIRHDRIPPTLKVLSRVKLIQMQLFDQWAVLETLTPSEYMEFRGVLGNASGFQSFQYRKLEFLLGNKNPDTIKVFAHDAPVYDDLLRTLQSPSIYDEFLRYLARRGYNIPAACLDRDWSAPHIRNEALIDIFRCRGVLPALAIPSSQDRRAHHRLPPRHRRLFRRRLSPSGARAHLLPRIVGFAHRSPAGRLADRGAQR